MGDGRHASAPAIGEPYAGREHPIALACFIKERARELGFQAAGFTDAQALEATEEVVLQRVEAGLMEGLGWFTPARTRLSCRPSELLPGAKSIIALASSYYSPVEDPATARRGTSPRATGAQHRGRIARYAWGQDYHVVLRERMTLLVEDIGRELGYRPGARIFVDSSPLVDRAVAHKTGVGWYGKNTNILVRGLGSWVFLGAIILDIDLPPDEPLLTNCGSCDLCIRACPTGALIDQYTLDNQRCISFQTIENRGTIPHELRPLMGDWVFGCDICQDVCPVNDRAVRAGGTPALPVFAPKGIEDALPSLQGLMLTGQQEYQERFRGRAVKRAKQRGLQRNAAVALGNTGDRDVLPALEQGMTLPEGVVRSHVAWAMGRIGGRRGRQALERARAREAEPDVLAEIDRALEQC